MRGKLNLFQATMLRWRELHPYSAVHVVKVPQPLDESRLREQLALHLEDLGLTGLVLDRQREEFEFQGGPANIDLKVLAAEGDPLAVICGEIERQINTAFPGEGKLAPFRFFAIDVGQAFHFGLAYDHFIAGGDSIAVLLGGMVQRYTSAGKGAPESRRPRLYPKTYRRLFLRHPIRLLRGMASLPRMAASCRRSFRPPARVDCDPYNGFVHFRVDPVELGALVRAVKAWGVTLNDALLAMLLQALAPVTAERSHASRRRELAVASIMNIRREFESDANEAFGQFLGSFRISHPVPPGMSLQQLARDVHAETNQIKSKKLYLQTLLALGFSGVVWPFLSVDRRRRFYAKSYPVWAGLTTLNANPLWSGTGQQTPPLEYVRAASTGPLAPMVFAITTAGDVMHVGISFRMGDVARELVDVVAANFLRFVRDLS